MFVDKPCIDCHRVVTFPVPGDATCPACGLPMYLTDSGQLRRYPSQGWTAGGIRGRRRPLP